MLARKKSTIFETPSHIFHVDKFAICQITIAKPQDKENIKNLENIKNVEH